MALVGNSREQIRREIKKTEFISSDFVFFDTEVLRLDACLLTVHLLLQCPLVINTISVFQR